MAPDHDGSIPQGGQAHHKLAAHPRAVTADLDRTPVHLDQTAHQGQPNAQPLGHAPGHAVGLSE